jgi:hypothetical protein
MNTEKLKIEFNRSELQALFELINSSAPPTPNEDPRAYVMASFLVRKTFLSITKKLMILQPSQTAKLSFQLAEAVALTIMLNHANAQLAWNEYNENLILKIHRIVNQKLA